MNGEALDSWSQELALFTNEVHACAARYLKDGKGNPETCLRMATGLILLKREQAAEFRKNNGGNIITFG